jgi:hypothetical protein
MARLFSYAVDPEAVRSATFAIGPAAGHARFEWLPESPWEPSVLPDRVLGDVDAVPSGSQ